MDKFITKKLFFNLIFISLSFNGVSQITNQYTFYVQRNGDSLNIESCLSFDLYNRRLILPEQQSNSRQSYDYIPIHVIGSKWQNNCLYIRWPLISDDEIISYIKEFTLLSTEQIILSER